MQTPLFLLLAASAAASPTLPLAKNYTSFAHTTFHVLQTWYDQSTGLWDTMGWWNGANAITAIGDLAAVDKSVRASATSVFAHTYTQAPAFNPGFEVLKESGPDFVKTTYGTPVAEGLGLGKRQSVDGWIDTCYDDNGWWALAWINAYDLTGIQNYLETAEGILAEMANSNETTCGGGIYWCSTNTYVNAIANELLLSVAAHLANRASNGSAYYTIAQKQWNWFYHQGFINSQNLINDGLLEDCTNNNAPMWSYNQGVVLGGLVEMHKFDPKNHTYLQVASTLANASVHYLTDENHVIHEWACEPNCAPDGTQFKGIYARNLLALHKRKPNPLYKQALIASAKSIWNNDRDLATNELSVNWQGPYVAPANASTQSSALDALVAAQVLHDQ